MSFQALRANLTTSLCGPISNNVVEQDHRAIKRIIKPMMGFKEFRCARIILSGIEIAHMIRKGQMCDDGVASTAAEQFYSLAA
ncbi:transposase-like protein [Paraburkholderia sp. MM5384-R2]|nr:DDE-type integrase/transposase/recombinase [Paraburkholderia sp. MM5384-R2]MBB5503707.1 transposase-like protein [Paraburkholderia sp. MM5384-R2]